MQEITVSQIMTFVDVFLKTNDIRNNASIASPGMIKPCNSLQQAGQA